MASRRSVAGYTGKRKAMSFLIHFLLFNNLKNGDYFDEPYNLYQEYSIDNDLISDDAFEQRKHDLKFSAELLPVLSAETINRVATLLRYLYFHDLIDASPDFIDSADYLAFKKILEGESIQDALEYIVRKIENYGTE